MTMTETSQLLNIVINTLEDTKAQNVKVLDVKKISNITDTMVIATGTSNRQVVSIAQRLIENVKSHGIRPLGDEGSDAGEWVLVDLGDVIVHLMQPEIREFYQLEKLWQQVM